jgi:hypothetical protein
MAPKQCGKFHDFSKSSEIANHPVGVVGICRRNKNQHLDWYYSSQREIICWTDTILLNNYNCIVSTPRFRHNIVILRCAIKKFIMGTIRTVVLKTKKLVCV